MSNGSHDFSVVDNLNDQEDDLVDADIMDARRGSIPDNNLDFFVNDSPP